MFVMSSQQLELGRRSPVQTRPPFDRIALILQGGGALGSYQAGAFQALAEAGLEPDWVAGISIGAVNAALIAGNTPQHRVDRLRAFWEAVSTSTTGLPYLRSLAIRDAVVHRALNQFRAVGILLFGAPNFFVPRVPAPLFWPAADAATVSFYDVAPLRETLERLVDFNRLNLGAPRLSVGAVNVRTGNFIYFDTKTNRIDPEHVMASGSLPPGFPPARIDGEYYWDGGIVSNTPLDWVLDVRPREDTLVFQVDLWSALGELPRDIAQAETREKDIRFSSRTRAATDRYRRTQKLRRAVGNLLKRIPEDWRDEPELQMLAEEASEKVCNIVQLIYHAKTYEGVSKDFEFSRRTMEEHWQAGYEEASRSLRQPEILERPDESEGVRIFDFSQSGATP
jgi:NTE family protein